MNKLLTLTLASLFTTAACADSTVFTTLGSNGKDIYAGVKIEKKDHEPETHLVEVSGKDLKEQKIALPTELSHREVIALFRAQKNQLVVITQQTIEQGDKPQVHSFDPAKKTWKKIAEVDCVSFTKLKLEKAAIIVQCLETNAQGKEVEKAQKVALKDTSLTDSGEKTLPLTKIEKEGLKAELIGESFEWTELKITDPKGSVYLFKAER